MQKNKIKAVAVDMDGTFVNSNNTYNRRRFAKVLDQLHDRGIHFIVASGRPLARLNRDFSGFMDRIDLVSDNGAVLVRDGKIINTHTFTYQNTLKIYQFIAQNFPNSSIIICGLNNSYILNGASSQFMHFMQFYYPNYVLINDLSEIPTGEQIDKITTWTKASAEQIEDGFNQIYPEKIHATSSGFNCLDIVPFGVNKASGLKYFLRYFNLKPENLMAFGDGMNDYEMMKLAGYSYAMKNGEDELKKVAKYEAPTNNEDGVLVVLENYLKK